MITKAVTPNILCIETRQEQNDKDYGSCLWARFLFNLDRYELSISSDCGNYGHKWVETPNTESFLKLMSRCDKGYMLDKLYGPPDIFDFDKTIKTIYDIYDDEDDRKKLNEIFDSIERNYDTAYEFIQAFKNEDINDQFDEYDLWTNIEKVYPANALKICDIFENNVKPYIQNMLQNKASKEI